MLCPTVFHTNQGTPRTRARSPAGGLRHADDRLLEGGLAVVVGRVLGDVADELGDLAVVLELPLEATEQDLEYSRGPNPPSSSKADSVKWVEVFVSLVSTVTRHNEPTRSGAHLRAWFTLPASRR